MISSILAGGLGNQMFQIAAGYALAKRISSQFGLNYNLKHNKGQGQFPLKYKDNFYKNINPIEQLPQNIYQAPFFHYSPVPQRSDLTLSGYFQSEKFFKDCPQIKDLWSFPNNIIEKCNKALNKLPKPIIGIHIRMGDYLAYPTVHGVNFDYYNTALKIIQEKVKPGTYIICSDELNYNPFKDIECILSNSKDELEDLYILSQCDNLILCNSSFSWWGEYLGIKKQNVICPAVWFKKDGPQDYQDIFRDGWIKI